MKTKLLFLFIVVSTLLISCSSDDDSSETSTFQGEWSGTFEGDDSGTWEATINGNLSGEFISINFPEGFTVLMTGNVNSEGEVQATYDHQFLSGTFTGVLSSETGSGTWTNDEDGSNGTWAGTKN